MAFLAAFLLMSSLMPAAALAQDAPAQQPAAGAVPVVVAESAEPEYNLELPLTFPDAAAEGNVTVRFDEQASGDRLELAVTRAQVALTQVTGEQVASLGESAEIKPGEDGSVVVTLCRRMDRVSVLAGAQRILTAWEDATPGKLSLSASQGLLKPDDLYYQPYAAPDFTDDFMRGETESAGEWQVVSGSWKNTALIDSVDFAPRAANSFAFAAQAAPTAMATTGPGFWDDLNCGVSVRLLESGRAGIGFRVQDPANYYALTVEFGSPEASGRALLKLSKVVGGVEETLASATREVPIGQWYRLEAVACEDHLEAYLDGVPLLHAHDITFAQGLVALLAENCETAYFDDAKVEAYQGFSDDFESNGHARWKTIAGKWEVTTGSGGKCLTRASGEPALAVAGREDWGNYELRAQIKPGKGAVGLCFYWKGPSDYFLWRWTRGKHELVRVSEAGEEVLDEAPLELPSEAWASVVMRAGKDYVSARVNGGPAIEALTGTGLTGRAGVWADRGGRPAFDNVEVRFPPGYVPAELPQTMVTDAEMKEQFANPAEGWFSVTDEAHRPQAVGMNWNKGEYFDPVDMTIPVSISSAAAGKVTVKMESDQTGGEGGYQLTLTKPEGSRKLALELSRTGEALKQAEYEVGESGTCHVRFGRRGTFIVVYIDNQLVLSYRDRTQATQPPEESKEPSVQVEP